MKEVSNKAEEYLEAIYRLQERIGVARTTELASALSIVPGSVTNTVQHLKKQGFVEHRPYKGISLTPKGEQIALGVIGRHRLAERMLTDVLDAHWASVHESACRLEPALDGDLTNLFEKRLGYPRYCPHGNPVPSEEGEIEQNEEDMLTTANVDETVIVSRIIDEKRDKLLPLVDKGIKPGVEIHVLEKRDYSMVLQVAGKRCALDLESASNVLIKTHKVDEDVQKRK